VPPVFDLIARLGDVPPTELWEVFNMGVGFICVVAAERADDAVELLGRLHPGTARIGGVTDRVGVVEIEGLELR
jgi:phosphoribosylformylglycinamidine cyclo-ligase